MVKGLRGLFIIVQTTCLSAQSYVSDNLLIHSLSSPVDIPIYLSANYGELRSTHFHAGIDFKTGGVTRKNILAAADGFISRIKIQSGGYGKTIYIDHPNGLTTVYAHLDEFYKPYEEFVKENQYANKSYEVDIYLQAHQFSVRKGDFIAYSGNTGSSGGPHLHFEVRNSATQVPLNGLNFNFPIKDTRLPQMRRICVFNLDSNSTFIEKRKIENVIWSNDQYKLISGDTIKTSGIIGIGFEGYDYLDGSSNRCAVYKAELKVNNRRIYAHIIDEIPFHLGKFVNSHIDLPLKQSHGYRVQKMFPDPGNNLPVYTTLKDRGLIELKKDTVYHITLEIFDVYNNSSKLTFKVKGMDEKSLIREVETEYAKYFRHDQVNYFKGSNSNIIIPKGALTNDVKFTYSEENHINEFSYRINLHDNSVPIFESSRIAVRCNYVPQGLEDKLYIARYNEDGSMVYSGGTYEDGFVVTNVRSFGSYVVKIDTLDPVIRPVNVYKNANLSSNKDIRFVIKDNETSVKSFEGYIDSKWVLFEYDEKNDLIIHKLDKDKIEQNIYHDLELMVYDARDNLAVHYVRFFW